MATYKEMKTLKFPDSDVVYVITDDSKIAKNQGTDNVGKVLYIGDDGFVTLIDAKNLETELPEGILTYMEQTLSDEQKAQARMNIGASNFSGSYNDLIDKPTISSGSGDMSASFYDPDGSIANAGGIAAWITENYDNAEEMSY